MVDSRTYLNFAFRFTSCIFYHMFIRSNLQEGPEKISVFNLRTRTTSALESYNARLGGKIAGKANFFKFAKCLIEEEAVKVKEFRELIRSGNFGRNQ